MNGNLIEANDCSVMIEFLYQGSENVTITDNIIQFNAGYGAELYSVKNSKVEKNTYGGNGKSNEQQ